MALDDDALAFSDECWRLSRDRIKESDFKVIGDELPMDEEEWRRLCELLPKAQATEDDQDLLENWRTVKEEIIGGRIYGFVREQFPEISGRLLNAAHFSMGPKATSSVPEDDLARLPFAFRPALRNDLIRGMRLYASNGNYLRLEIQKALKREQYRRVIRPVIRLLTSLGILVALIVLWKLFT